MLKLTFGSYLPNEDDNDSGHICNNDDDDDGDDNDDDHIANAAADVDE